MQYFCVTIPQAVRPRSITAAGYRIFNVSTQLLGACRTLEGGLGNKQVRTSIDSGGTRKTVPHPAPPGPGDRTQGLWIGAEFVVENLLIFIIYRNILFIITPLSPRAF